MHIVSCLCKLMTSFCFEAVNRCQCERIFAEIAQIIQSIWISLLHDFTAFMQLFISIYICLSQKAFTFLSKPDPNETRHTWSSKCIAVHVIRRATDGCFQHNVHASHVWHVTMTTTHSSVSISNAKQLLNLKRTALQLKQQTSLMINYKQLY